MAAMRAKLKVTGVQQFPPVGQAVQENLVFAAVCANSYPEDGTDENNTFAKFTPNADLRMSVLNPTLLGKFKVGDAFYVDFTPAE